MPVQPKVVNQFQDADKTIRTLIDLLIKAYAASRGGSKEEAKQMLIQDLVRLLRKEQIVEATTPRGCVLPDGTVITPEECAVLPCSADDT